MFKKVWIIGCSDFALDIACRFNPNPEKQLNFIGLIDSRKSKRDLASNLLPKIRNQNDIFNKNLIISDPKEINFQDKNNKFIFGTSDVKFKKTFANKYNINNDQFYKYNVETRVGRSSTVGGGVYFRSFISNLTQIGNGNFLDTGTVVGHTTSIGNFNHISMSVMIGGNVKIGECNVIHSGAIIGAGITIGDNCVIGSGATVLRDLPSNTKVIAPKSIKIN